MSDWDLIMAEAEKVSREMRQRAVDLSGAEKAVDYFIDHGYDEAKMTHYLELLADNPPMRSKRSKRHYESIRTIWRAWRTPLTGADKVRAWGWAVRLAKVA